MKAHILLFSSLLLAAAVPQASAVEQVIVGWDQDWDYMHPMGTDPAIADTDFNTTWFQKASDFAVNYNGPPFGVASIGDPADPNTFDSGTGAGPLGYDSINYFTSAAPEVSAFGTTLTQPLNTRRYSAYFRTTFFAPQLYTSPRIRMILDDGALIYYDGVLIARVNKANNTEGYTQFASDTTATFNETLVSANNEDVIQAFGLTSTGTSATADSFVIVALPTITAGSHTLAISSRNNGVGSSDMCMGFELRGDDAGIVAVASNVQRQQNGPGFADDTFTFDVTVTANNLGGPSSWTSDNPPARGPVAGAYGVTVTYNYPAQIDLGTPGSATITFSDTVNPVLTSTLTVTAPPPPPGGPLVLAPATPLHVLNFEESAVGSSAQVRSVYHTEMGYTGNGVVWDDSVINAANGGTKAMRFVGVLQNMTTEAVGVDPAVKGIKASVTVRTFTTSDTTFESPDALRIIVEGSTDGTSWHDLGSVVPLLQGHTGGGGGGWPDNPEGIDQLITRSARELPVEREAPSDPVFTPLLVRSAIALQAGDAFVRVRVLHPPTPDGVTAPEALSGTENIFVDNIRLEVGLDAAADADSDGLTNGFEDFAGSNPNSAASAYRVTTSFGPTPGVPGSTRYTSSFPEGNFRAHVLEVSDDLAIWTNSQYYFGTAAGATITQTDDSTNTRRFYRNTVRY